MQWRLRLDADESKRVLILFIHIILITIIFIVVIMVSIVFIIIKVSNIVIN